MGRFYFHLRNGEEMVRDEEGTDLPDVTAALREAKLDARDLVIDAIRAGKDQVPDAIVIADEAGRSVGTVPLAIVLPKPLRTQGI